MTADVYIPTATQDENSGVIKKTWEKSDTVNCIARTIIRDTTSKNSSALSQAEIYIKSTNTIKLRTRHPINTASRIANISNSSGAIWTESSGGVEGSTIFEPQGSTPLLDHNGQVIEYETILERLEIQRLEV
jgi:hypothetical protein